MSRRNKFILAGMIGVVVIGILAIVLASSGGTSLATVTPSRANIQMEMEMTQDAGGNTVALGGNPVREVVVTVRGAPGIVGNDVFADSLAPSVATAVVLNNGASGNTRRIQITAHRSGETQIRVTTVGGNASTYISVRVDTPANSMALRENIHFAVQRPTQAQFLQNGEATIQFSDDNFYFFPTRDGRSFDFPATIYNTTFSPLGASSGIRLEGNRIHVGPNASTGIFWVRARLGATTSVPEGYAFDFPVYIFPQFGTVSIENLTAPTILNPEGEVIAQLVRNDIRLGRDFAEFRLGMAGWSLDNSDTFYGFSFEVINNNPTLVSTTPRTGSNFTISANVEGQTTIDVRIFPIITALDGSTILFNRPTDRHVQHNETIRVEIRNVFENDSLRFARDGEVVDELFAFASQNLVDRYEFQISLRQSSNVNNTTSHPHNDRVTFALLGIPVHLQHIPIDQLITITYSMSGLGFNIMQLSDFTTGIPVGANFSVSLSRHLTNPAAISDLISANLRLEVRSVTTVPPQGVGSPVAHFSVPLNALRSVYDINIVDSNGEEIEYLMPVVGATNNGFNFYVETNLGDYVLPQHIKFGFPRESRTPSQIDNSGNELGSIPLFIIEQRSPLNNGRIGFRIRINQAVSDQITIGTNYPFYIEYVNGFREHFQIHTLAQLRNLEMSVRPLSGGQVFDSTTVRESRVVYHSQAILRIGGIYQIDLSPQPLNASVSINLRTTGGIGLSPDNSFTPQDEGVFTLIVDLTSLNPEVLQNIRTTFTITIVVINPILHAEFSTNDVDVWSLETLSHFPGLPGNYRDSIKNFEIVPEFARPQINTPAMQSTLEIDWRYSEGPITLTQGASNLEFEVQGNFATHGFVPIDFSITQRFEFEINGNSDYFEIPLLTFSEPLQFFIRVRDAQMIDRISPLNARDDINLIITGNTLPSVPVRVSHYPTLVHNSRIGFAFMIDGTIFRTGSGGEVLGLHQRIYAPNGSGGQILLATVTDGGVVTAHASNLSALGIDDDFEIRLVIFSFDSIRRMQNGNLGLPLTRIEKSVFIFDQREGARQFLIETPEDWARHMGYNWQNPIAQIVAGRTFIRYTRPVANHTVDGHFRLGADLDFAGLIFDPIPNFVGQLHGVRNYAVAGGLQTLRFQIQNLTMLTHPNGFRNSWNQVSGSLPTQQITEHYGLFARVGYGESDPNRGLIRGLEFTNVQINMPSRSLPPVGTEITAHLGVLAGINYGTVIDVSVHIESGWYAMFGFEDLNIGAIIGTNNGTIREENHILVSGFLNVAHGFENPVDGRRGIHNVNLGGFTGVNRGLIQGRNAGGILGDNITINSEITLMLNAEQSIVPDIAHKNIGGIAGLSSGHISEVSSQGVLFNATRGNNGGIVGVNEASGTVEHSYSGGAIYARGVLGGIIGVNEGTVNHVYYDLYINQEVRDRLANILFTRLPQSVINANPNFVNNPFFAGLMVGRDANVDINTIPSALRNSVPDTIVGGVIGINSGDVSYSFASSIFTDRTEFGPRTVLGLPYRGDIYIHGASGRGRVIVGGVIGRQEAGTSNIQSVYSNLFITYSRQAGTPALLPTHQGPVIGGVIGDLAPGAAATVIAAYSYNHYNFQTVGDQITVGGIVGRWGTTANTTFTLVYTVLGLDINNPNNGQINQTSAVVTWGVDVGQWVGSAQSGRFRAFEAQTHLTLPPRNLETPTWTMGNIWTFGGQFGRDFFIHSPYALGGDYKFPFPLLRSAPNSTRPLWVATPTRIEMTLRTSAELRTVPPQYENLQPHQRVTRREIFGEATNTRGGFNYVIPAQTRVNGVQRAALMFTTGAPISSAFQANRYFLQDIFTIDIDPEVASGRYTIRLENNNNVAQLGVEVIGGIARNFITVFQPGTFDLVAISTRHEEGQEIYDRLTFDVIPGVTRNSVFRDPMGEIAWRSLSHNPLLSGTRPFWTQRGSVFSLRSEVNSLGWNTQIRHNGAVTSFENGGRFQLFDAQTHEFTFTPYLEHNGATYILTSLATTVTVHIYQGAIELSLAQDENRIDAMSAAVFSGVIVTDIAPLSAGELLNINQIGPTAEIRAQRALQRLDRLLYLVDLTFAHRDQPANQQPYSLFGREPDGTPIPQTRIPVTAQGRDINLVFTIEVMTIAPRPVLVQGQGYQDRGYFEYRFNIHTHIEVGSDAFFDVAPPGAYIPPNAIPVGLFGNLRVAEIVHDNTGGSGGRPFWQTPLRTNADLEITQQQLQSVTIQHFSDTIRHSNSEFSLVPDQTQSFNIHTAREGPGGIMKIHAGPGFSAIDSASLTSSQVELVVETIGTGQNAVDVYKTWEIGFVQLFWNIGTQRFEHYAGTLGEETPDGGRVLHQISSGFWDAELRRFVYTWDGVFYVRTLLQEVGNQQHPAQIPQGQVFEITANFESLGRTIQHEFELFSIDRPGLYFNFDGPNTREAVQAVGTRHEFTIDTFGDIWVDWGSGNEVTTTAVAGVTVRHIADNPNVRNRYELIIAPTVAPGQVIHVVFNYVHYTNGNRIPQTATLPVTAVLFRITGFTTGDMGNTIRLVNNSRENMSLRLMTQRYRGNFIPPGETSPLAPDSDLIREIDDAIRELQDQINVYGPPTSVAQMLTWRGRNAMAGYILNVGDLIDEYFDNLVGPRAGTPMNQELNFFLGRGEESGTKFITAGVSGAGISTLEVQMFFEVTTGTTAGRYRVVNAGNMSVTSEFTIVTVIQSDEANPIPIYNAPQLRQVGQTANAGEYFILMADIQLVEWEPLPFLAASLDGNNRRIFLSSNSLVMPEPLRNTAGVITPAVQTFNIGVFTTISSNSVVKNLNLVMPRGIGPAGEQGMLAINTTQLGDGAIVNVGVLAGTNSGIVTNVSVSTNGIFAPDNNGFYTALTPKRALRTDFDSDRGMARSRLDVRVNNPNATLRVGGLVGLNEGTNETTHGVITNSRVLVDIHVAPASGGNNHAQTANIGGFVGENRGFIVASMFRDGNVVTSIYAGAGRIIRTAGFVGLNGPLTGAWRGVIRSSYAMGASSDLTVQGHVTMGGVGSLHPTFPGSVAGFAFANAGMLEDNYTNILLNHGTFRAGFVFQNVAGGTVQNNFANNPASSDIAEVGVSGSTHIFINDLHNPPSGLLSNNRVFPMPGAAHAADLVGGGSRFREITTDFASANFAGFSLSEVWEVRRPNIWHQTHLGPRLVSPDHIAVSIRIVEPIEISPGRFRVSYHQDYAYGSFTNPIIITNGNQFNRHIYNNSPGPRPDEHGQLDWNHNVYQGYIRLVNNISVATSDLTDPELDSLRTYSIIFRGQLDGNGLAIRGISINAETTSGLGLNSAGLFSRLEYATVKNIDLFFAPTGNYSITAPSVYYVGGLAGIAINSNIVDVNVRNMTNSATAGIVGKNIVGGVVGAVLNFNYEQNENSEGNMGEVFKIQNVHANIPVRADERFTEAVDLNFAHAGQYLSHELNRLSIAGGLFGLVTADINSVADRPTFMRDINGNEITGAVHQMPTSIGGNTVYNIMNIGNFIRSTDNFGIISRAEVVGGLIGAIGEGITVYNSGLRNAVGLSATNNYLQARFYVGGIAGINMGQIIDSTVELPSMNLRALSNTATHEFIFIHTNPAQLFGLTVGGIAGFNSGTIRGGASNIAMTGTAFSQAMSVGGVAGENMGGTINNVRIDGAIHGGFYLGAIVGINHGGGNLNDNIISPVAAGGVGTAYSIAWGQASVSPAREVHTSFPRPTQVNTPFGVQWNDPFNLRPAPFGRGVFKSNFTGLVAGFVIGAVPSTIGMQVPSGFNFFGNI